MSKPRLALCLPEERGWVGGQKERESAKERVATGRHREALCVDIVGLAPC